MSQRFFGILFLFVLLVPVSASFLWLDIQRETIREEVKTHLLHSVEEEDLTQIIVHVNDAHSIHWKEKNEFRYKSKMYDVVRSEKQGEFLVYQCWQDEDETQIENKFESLLNTLCGSDDSEQHTELQLTLLLDNLDLPQTYGYHFIHKPGQKCLFAYQSRITPGEFAIDTPPPRLS